MSPEIPEMEGWHPHSVSWSFLLVENQVTLNISIFSGQKRTHIRKHFGLAVVV